MKACPAHAPGEKPRPATVRVGARDYCREHAAFFGVKLEPVLVARAKRKERSK